MPSFKWHTFWMAPCLISYFIVISFCIERKRFLMRNLATILPLKPKLSGKFQRFNAIDGSIKLLKKSWISKKIPVKIKNCKAFYKTQTASRLNEIIYLFGTKLFWGSYTEIFRHLLSKYFENGVFGRQEMLQCKCFFWHQTERCLLENL